MPGEGSKSKLASAGEFAASDKESDLITHLQKQLEEDIARIFDESIYSDLEVVCGKLKILTHTCILKARTSKFFHKLESILHVSIGQSTFDEIYSFISDAYTECNIELQEREIISYLNEIFHPLIPIVHNKYPAKEDSDKTHPFYIPDCTENSCNQNIFPKTKGSSSSTELTKEYYELVPTSGNLLEKELTEQDVLSNSFLSIIKTQVKDKAETKSTKPSKPTVLSFPKNNCNQTITQSNKLNKELQRNNISEFEDSYENFSPTNSIQESKLSCLTASCKPHDLSFGNCELNSKVFIDSTYSPDSLITDEPSSASDYLSATFTCSPGTSISDLRCTLNADENFTKMSQNGVFTKSDSGLDSTGMLENLNTHLDVTLTDHSMTETHLHSTIQEEAANALDCEQSMKAKKQERKMKKHLPSASVDTILIGKEPCASRHVNKPKNSISGKSAKEEKQRQNEEIVTLESSSLSSETGSWEPVFPPKLNKKNISNKTNKKQNKLKKEEKFQERKRSAGFIEKENDAVSLPRNSKDKLNKIEERANPIPIPVSRAYSHEYREDTSSAGLTNMSEENDNDGSFELLDDLDTTDESRTIFDMTFETSFSGEDVNEITCLHSLNSDFLNNTVTPNNSIMSIKEHELLIANKSNFINKQPLNDLVLKTGKMNVGDQNQFSNSPRSNLNRKVNNASHVNFTEMDDQQRKNEIKINKPSNAAAWVVDMSKESNSDCNIKVNPNNTDENVFEKTKSVSKSNKENDKNLSLLDSESSNKLSRSFYVDLTNLPEPVSANSNNETARVNEKDNIFTMYIDIGNKSAVKGKPPILQSTNARKNFSAEPKLPNKCCLTSNVKSSGESLTTFEKLESLCNDTKISITEIIKIPVSQDETCVIKEIEPSKDVKINKKENDEKMINNTNKQNPTVVIEEESVFSDSAKGSGDTFVKLSDLDKPALKLSDFDNLETTPTSETLREDKIWDVRMTRSIPDNNWGCPAHSGSSVITSFHSENALSLNRLFPHLLNQFSRSVPASLPGRPRSLLKLENPSNLTEEEAQPSDTSDISSIQSSACRSIAGNSTTEESSQTSSLAGSCQSRLGQDLLRMFLEEIATDVIVEVNGKRIKAHKCILSSRCQFFAGILSGGYVESAGNVIILPSFSYSVAHFAMCHIYAGISDIPDSISIPELATLADMLGLEGLKEAIMFTLKVKYCHHFHKPCQVCIAGVLECFPLSSVYGLDDLYLKCLKWITKHFVKVWPTKAFATLPTELLEKCFHQHAINFTTENFVEMVYGYGLTMASVQNNRWAEILVRMCRRLIQAAAHFAASQLADVLRTIGHVSATVSPPALQALEECLTAAIDWAPCEEACRAYAFLSNTVRDIKSQQQQPQQQQTPTDQSHASSRKPSGPNSLLFYRAAIWRLQCEGALVRAAPRVVNTKAFQELPGELKKRLRELGCILFVPHVMPHGNMLSDKRKTQKPKSSRSYSTSVSRSFDLEQVRAAFVPYSAKPAVPVSAVDPEKYFRAFKEVKKSFTTQPPKVRMTKAQEQRAKFNMNKNIKRVEQAYAKTVVSTSKQSEPRAYKENEKALNAPNKENLKTMTSSESSQNSIPNQVKRHQMPSTSGIKHQTNEKKAYAMSQDSLSTVSRPHTAEPATDSLSDSRNSAKCGTYTKEKRVIKSSVESIKSTKSHAMARGEDTHGKMKTKIPVTINHNLKSLNKAKAEAPKKTVNVAMASNAHAGNTLSPLAGNKFTERKVGGSLMKATKSSSAKTVPKMVKDHSKTVTKYKNSPKMANKAEHTVPTMSRSGTFLMEEPSTSNNNMQ